MLLSVIAALTLLSGTFGQSPAIQVIMTDKGLQYGKHKGTDWVQNHLELVTLPDISGSVIGISYTLSGIKISKCDLPEPSVNFYPDATGFKVSILGLSVALSGEWRTHLGLIHDGGTFDLAIFNVDTVSAVHLGRDAEGRLTVSSEQCDAQVGNVDINFYGGASWIFRDIVKHFKQHIGGEIQSRICPYVDQLFVNMENHLQAMNVSYDVNQELTLDLLLTNLPVIDVSSLYLPLKGEFYDIKTHKEPPFVAQSFKLPERQDYMLSVGLSEFTLNSASYGYYLAGAFQILVNDSMIPPGCPLHLNTSLMGPYIPQLPKMFPGLLMSLQVYARDVPMFSFQPGSVKLGFQGTVKAFALQPNGTQSPLFKLNVDSAFTGKVWLADETVKGVIAMENFTISLVESEVGTFKVDALQSIVSMGMKMVILTQVNKKLSEGINLPRTKYAHMVNSVLSVEKGFIAFSSDAEVQLSDQDFTRQRSRFL